MQTEVIVGKISSKILTLLFTFDVVIRQIVPVYLHYNEITDTK